MANNPTEAPLQSATSNTSDPAPAHDDRFGRAPSPGLATHFAEYLRRHDAGRVEWSLGLCEVLRVALWSASGHIGGEDGTPPTEASMTEDAAERGDTPEFIATKAMWYSGALPEAGLLYVVFYVLLQIVLLPIQWLRRVMSRVSS